MNSISLRLVSFIRSAHMLLCFAQSYALLGWTCRPNFFLSTKDTLPIYSSCKNITPMGHFHMTLTKSAGGTINELLAWLLFNQAKWKYRYRWALLRSCIKSHAPQIYCRVIVPWRIMLTSTTLDWFTFWPLVEVPYTTDLERR